MEGRINSRRMFLVRCLWKFIPDSRGHNIKASLLRWAGARVGENVEIMSSAKIIGNFNLFIGDCCFIGHDSLIFGPEDSTIIIEDFAKIGSRSVLVTGQHRYSIDGHCIAKEGTFKDIRICKGAVVSTGVIILPGKIINTMSHVAAGSVVTKDVPEFVRVGGIPAKVIKNFKESC